MGWCNEQEALLQIHHQPDRDKGVTQSVAESPGGASGVTQEYRVHPMCGLSQGWTKCQESPQRAAEERQGRSWILAID